MKKHIIAAGIVLSLCGSAAVAAITSGAVETYYANPYSGTENISSFDWSSTGDLYWMGGDANWAASMNVYKYNGSTLSAIDSRSSYAGSWVARNGNYMYFDDGTAYSFNKYDTVNGGAASQVFQQANVWGYTFNNNGLFISGADESWNNSLFYSAIDGNGDLTGSLVTLGFVGAPSGPMAFDTEGNLFYAAGYSVGKIYKYTAAEVAAAIAGTALGDAATHEYIDFNSYGLAGATGMAFDDEGNLVASLTSFTDPCKLVSFDIDESGNYLGTSSVLAESDGRMTTVRNNSGDIYFSDGDGIYKAVPEPASVLLIMIGSLGIVGYRRLFAKV
jgi:hypothetical protein